MTKLTVEHVVTQLTRVDGNDTSSSRKPRRHQTTLLFLYVRAKGKGLVRSIGVSNMDPEVWHLACGRSAKLSGQLETRTLDRVYDQIP
jgi:hypothetical protein